MFCPVCGTENKTGARFCLNCGQPLQQAQAPAPGQQQYAGQQQSQQSSRTGLFGGVRRAVRAPRMAVPVWAIAVLAAVLISGVAVAYLTSRPISVNVMDGVEVEFSGPDGYASASVSGSSAWREAALEILDEKADDTDEYEDWVEDLSEVVVTFEVDPDENLSNGDTVTVTATIKNENALSDLPITLVTEEFTVEVSGLSEAEVVNLFEDIEVSYDGLGPTAVPSVTGTCAYISDIIYTCEYDGVGVDYGDTFTITAEYDEDVLLANGYVAESDELEYTATVTSYVDALSEIDDESMATMKAQAESVLDAYFAGNWDPEEATIRGKTYLGCYFFTPKTISSSTMSNTLVLVYKVAAWDEYNGDSTYYVGLTYEDLIILASGTFSVDLDSCSMTSNSFSLGTFPYIYYYRGYQSYESLFSAYVTANAASWTYEDTASENA